MNSHFLNAYRKRTSRDFGLAAVLIALALVPAPATATDLDLGDVASVSIGGAQTARVTVGPQGNLATATIGGSSTANVTVGGGIATATIGGSPNTGTPGTPGNPIAEDPNAPGTAPRKPRLFASCGASQGNTGAYTGFALLDRNGVMVGTVRATTLDGARNIAALTVMTAAGKCKGLNGGSYAVSGAEIRGDFDATRLN